MARGMNRFTLDPMADAARGPMGRGPMGMPPPHMMKGMPPGMPMDRAMHMRDGPKVRDMDKDAEEWERAFAQADGRPDEELFAQFEQFYGRAPPPAMSHFPPGRMDGSHAPLRPQGNWSDEFAEQEKFAEFERIYRTYWNIPHPITRLFFTDFEFGW